MDFGGYTGDIKKITLNEQHWWYVSMPVYLLFCCLLLLMTGCKSYRAKQDELPDTPERGTIHISADESFKPVIDEHVQVYEAIWPETHIIVHYKPEADALKDLQVDSIRMVIATEVLTPMGRKLYDRFI